MTTSTPATTSQSCAPCTSTSDSTSWSVGILVGVVSGVLLMIIVWVIVTVVSKKKSIIDGKRNIERFNMTIIVEF